MRWIFVAIALATTLAGAADARAKNEKFVEVGGQRYRVQIEGREALVFNKAAVVRWSLTERNNRVEAARLATGCGTGEVLFAAPRLSVELICDAIPGARP